MAIYMGQGTLHQRPIVYKKMLRFGAVLATCNRWRHFAGITVQNFFNCVSSRLGLITGAYPLSLYAYQILFVFIKFFLLLKLFLTINNDTWMTIMTYHDGFR